MQRATTIRRASGGGPERIADTVTLDYDERRRRRIVLTGERGTTFLLDLPHAVTLRDGDGLVLDDGAIVRVVGKPEPLLEITAGGAGAVDGASSLARLAWHLGNRHVEVQVVGERLRIRRDHVLEAMLRGLGATLTRLEAPFEPEAGAYGHAGAHDHAHGPSHDHGDDHDHGHGA